VNTRTEALFTKPQIITQTGDDDGTSYITYELGTSTPTASPAVPPSSSSSSSSAAPPSSTRAPTTRTPITNHPAATPSPTLAPTTHTPTTYPDADAVWRPDDEGTPGPGKHWHCEMHERMQCQHDLKYDGKFLDRKDSELCREACAEWESHGCQYDSMNLKCYVEWTKEKRCVPEKLHSSSVQILDARLQYYAGRCYWRLGEEKTSKSYLNYISKAVNKVSGKMEAIAPKYRTKTPSTKAPSSPSESFDESPPTKAPSNTPSSPATKVPTTRSPSSPPTTEEDPHAKYEEQFENVSACSASMQSPIDIQTENALKKDQLVLKLQYSKGSNPFLLIKNTGKVIQIEGTALNHDVAVWGGKNYQLQSIEFHHGSENRLDGTQYPLEAQLVHKDLETNKLLIVAILFKNGPANGVLDEDLAWAKMPAGTSGEITINPFDLSKMIPSGALEYYAYTGTTTSAPCQPNVQWIVLKNVQSISERQIEQFPLKENYRSTQPRAARVVSLGGSS